MSLSGPAVDQGEKNRKLLHDLQKTKQMMMKSPSGAGRSNQPPLLSSISSLTCGVPFPGDGSSGSNSMQGATVAATAGGAQQQGVLKSSINFYPSNSNYGNQLLPGFPRFLPD
ncbi:hypothetical protein GPALN_006265 [Globodera pallida]|nr:hypothetical protein GPALN_006265 [Globodera pallida]